MSEDKNIKTYTTKLSVPSFEVDTNTAFMLHNSKDLTPIQTHMLSELNILNQKMDWTMDKLVELNENLESDTSIVNDLSEWKDDIEEWKQDCDKRVNEIDKIVSGVRLTNEKFKFLKSFSNFLLTAFVSFISTMGAILLIVDQLKNFIK